MANVSFNADFGGFSIRQSQSVYTDGLHTTGAFHRLTPEQFDALLDVFEVVDGAKTLTTDGRYGAPKTFRTAEIDFGGLTLSLYADVPAHEADPNQLSLTEL